MVSEVVEDDSDDEMDSCHNQSQEPYTASAHANAPEKSPPIQVVPSISKWSSASQTEVRLLGDRHGPQFFRALADTGANASVMSVGMYAQICARVKRLGLENDIYRKRVEVVRMRGISGQPLSSSREVSIPLDFGKGFVRRVAFLVVKGLNASLPILLNSELATQLLQQRTRPEHGPHRPIRHPKPRRHRARTRVPRGRREASIRDPVVASVGIREDAAPGVKRVGGGRLIYDSFAEAPETRGEDDPLHDVRDAYDATALSPEKASVPLPPTTLAGLDREMKRLHGRCVEALDVRGGIAMPAFEDIEFDEGALIRHGHIAYAQKKHGAERVGEEFIARLTEAGVVVPVAWPKFGSSPALVVLKPGSPGAEKRFRMVVDYRSKNELIKNKASMGMPSPFDLAKILEGAKKFMVFDLVDAFHQCPITEGLSHRLAFNFQNRYYRFKRAPQGFALSGTILQAHLNVIFEGLIGREREGILIYADDILVYAPDMEAFARILASVNDRLEKFNLFLKKDKIQGPSEDVVWNAYRLTADGIQVVVRNEDNIARVTPTNGEELNKLVGVLNYLIDNVVNLAQWRGKLQVFLMRVSRSFDPPTTKNAKLKRVQFADFFTDAERAELDEIVREVRAAVQNRPRLVTLRPGDERVVITDASTTGWAFTTFRCPREAWLEYLGGTTSFQDLPLRLVWCQSGLFSASQLNWTIHRKEFYALVYGLRECPFQGWSEAQPMNVFIDNMDVVTWLRPKSTTTLHDHNVQWVQRWLQWLSSHRFLVWHNPGESVTHFLADDLSRQGAESPAHDDGASELANGETSIGAVLADPDAGEAGGELEDEEDELDEGDPRDDVGIPEDPRIPGAEDRAEEPGDDHNARGLDSVALTEIDSENFASETPESARDPGEFALVDGMWREVSSGRILVPEASRHLVMVVGHNWTAGHRATDATVQMISRHFVWDTLAEDVAKFVRGCVHCLTTTGPARTFLPWGTVRQGARFGDVVHLDHVQMTPTASGAEWILLMVDDFTKLTVLEPVRSTSHMDMWNALVRGWMRYFGAPRWFVCDNGAAFAAQRFAEECKILGTRVHLTTPNIPQTHAVVERTARYFRETCAKVLSEKSWSPDLWDEVLPTVQCALNQTPTERLGGHSAVELAFAMDAVDPIARLRNYVDPTAPFGRDLEEHLHWIRERLAEWSAEATAARNARNERVKATRAKRAGAQFPPAFPPGTFVLVSSADSRHRGLRAGPTWGTIAQVVRQQSQFRYLIQDTLHPFKRTTRHAQDLRFFEAASFNMPAALQRVFRSSAEAEHVVDSFLDLEQANQNFNVLVKWRDFEEPTWENVGIMAADVRAKLQAYLRARLRQNPQDPLVAGVYRKYARLRRPTNGPSEEGGNVGADMEATPAGQRPGSSDRRRARRNV